MHICFEVFVPIPVTVRFLDHDIAFNQQSFQYFFNVKTSVFCIPDTERNVFKIAKRLIPKSAYASLEEQGIDLSAIDKIIDSEGPLGVLLEVEDHKKNEKTVISIE